MDVNQEWEKRNLYLGAVEAQSTAMTAHRGGGEATSWVSFGPFIREVDHYPVASDVFSFAEMVAMDIRQAKKKLARDIQYIIESHE